MMWKYTAWASLWAVAWVMPFVLVVSYAQAQEGLRPGWLWYPEGDPAQEAPAAACYFRKTLRLARPAEAAFISVTADNSFVLYVNDKEVGRGDNWQKIYTFDLVPHLTGGRNIIAVRAVNDGGAAGFLAWSSITLVGGDQMGFRTDANWKVDRTAQPGWTEIGFDDSKWQPPRVLGEVGKVARWGLVGQEAANLDRFTVPAGFTVQRVAEPDLTGSLICMTFDGKGRPLVCRERGPISTLIDADGDGRYEQAKVYSDKVTNCQGLLWLDGHVWAVGDGPDKPALYRLTDTSGDDQADEVKTIHVVKGSMGDHGPHAVLYGPDGWLYLVLGNHAHLTAEPEPSSNHRAYYEGDLFPKIEDARGHAVGVKAPGGTIVRFDRAGKRFYQVVGDFRNQYDADFNELGELFTFDSDMEWDVGLPWYRPVRVNHCPPGAEFGWRSGAGKWPEYYFDSLPTTVDVGRGSPVGVTFYEHSQFPDRYRGAFIIADWSYGRILAIHLEKSGATYTGTREDFIVGRPLNVTDVEVGPDGALYFSTGGRGTEGGLYRVSYAGNAPAAAAPGAAKYTGVEAALHQVQPNSAWARLALRTIRDQLGPVWGRDLVAAARDRRRSAGQRVRAITLLQKYGPFPTLEFALGLADDPLWEVRASAAFLLGQMRGDQSLTALIKLLADPEPFVRRRACEALVRGDMAPPPDALLPLLVDSDRWLRFAARTALMRIDPSQWQELILNSEEPRLLLEGMLALASASPGAPGPGALLDRELALLKQDLPSDLCLDLLRLIQVTLLAVGEDRSAVPGELFPELLRRFPTADWRQNRELARLLAYVQEPQAVPKLLAEMRREHSREQQIHYAYCLRRFHKGGWTPDGIQQMLDWYEFAALWEGGHSASEYMERIAEDWLPVLADDDRQRVLRSARAHPVVARALVRTGDLAAEPRWLAALDKAFERPTAVAQSDVQPAPPKSPRLSELELAIIDALARSDRPETQPLLRRLFQEGGSLRDPAVRALARIPNAANWLYFVEGLDTADRATRTACIAALKKIDRKPSDAQTYRAVILAAQQSTGDDAWDAVELLSKWAGRPNGAEKGQAAAALEGWRKWFAEAYPKESSLSAANPKTSHQWAYSQLVSLLDAANLPKGSLERGREVFKKTKCLDCHRFGTEGQGVGPDLSTVARRFKRREIIEAMVDPSKVIADQYRSVLVATFDGRVINGLPITNDDAKLELLQSDGTRITVPKSDIEDQVASNVSVMPPALLDSLSLDEIADLLAFLETPPPESPVASGGK